MRGQKDITENTFLFNDSALGDVLPQLTDVASGNIHIYEFMLQAWALLSCAGELQQEKYHSEFGNLRDLADSLSGYIEVVSMSKCYDILECIRHLKAGKSDRFQISRALSKAERHSYIEIHYRKGVLMNQLQMHLDLGEHGAFGISRGSDMVQIVDTLLQGKESVKALDLGSGNGFSTFVLSNKVDHVTGIEINLELYRESLVCMRDLTQQDKVDEHKISFVLADFFDIDFAPYSFIYIYWPFDDLNKRIWEQKIRERLELKIITESQAETLIAAMIPGVEEKCLFPNLERIPIDMESLCSVAEVYRVVK